MATGAAVDREPGDEVPPGTPSPLGNSTVSSGSRRGSAVQCCRRCRQSDRDGERIAVVGECFEEVEPNRRSAQSAGDRRIDQLDRLDRNDPVGVANEDIVARRRGQDRVDRRVDELGVAERLVDKVDVEAQNQGGGPAGRRLRIEQIVIVAEDVNIGHLRAAGVEEDAEHVLGVRAGHVAGQVLGRDEQRPRPIEDREVGRIVEVDRLVGSTGRPDAGWSRRSAGRPSCRGAGRSPDRARRCC